ncbi:MAG: DVU0298 family protein [Candidatus Sulfomarinibacteraceae bacterium]
MELLRAGDEQALGALVAAEPRATRHLLGRLWDPDEAVRLRAARGIGVAAAAHPEHGIDLTRRLMWALNDESATNGLFGIAAIAEIGSCNPELIAPFVAPLASLAWDDGLRLEILRALARISETAPELVRPVVAEVGDHVDEEDPAECDAFARLLEESGGLDES